MSRGHHIKLSNRGFTIVELLIVIVVIAILAAITIVAYNGISNRAKQSALQSSVSQAAKKIINESVINNGTYPADLTNVNLGSNGNVSFQYSVNNSTQPKGFCLTATGNGLASYIAKSYTYGAGTVLDQGNPIPGPCPGHSGTGGPLSTNLVTNPSMEDGTVNGWTTSSANLSAYSSWASSGAYSARVTNISGGGNGDMRTPTSASTFPFGMEPGKTYTISARLYFTAAPTDSFSRSPGVIIYYSTNGSSYTQETGPKAPTTPGIYTVSHTFTVPVNTTGLIVAFGVASSTVSQTFYYDSIMITEGSTVENFADGNTPGWIWKGTTNASASTGPTQ